MISIKTESHVGPDGLLTVQIPTTFSETDVEVLLVLQPVFKNGSDSRGWPPGSSKIQRGPGKANRWNALLKASMSHARN